MMDQEKTTHHHLLDIQVLTTSLGDKSFKISHIEIANTIMQYMYTGTVIACFLFSMGNRPKAARWKYIAAVKFTFSPFLSSFFTDRPRASTDGQLRFDDSIYAGCSWILCLPSGLAIVGKFDHGSNRRFSRFNLYVPRSVPALSRCAEQSCGFIDGCYVLASLIAGDPWVRFLREVRTRLTRTLR